jgi:hypothetical protein
VRFVCLTCFGDFALTGDEWTHDKHYAAGMRLCTGTVVREDDPRFAPALAQQRPYTAEDADSARRFVRFSRDRTRLSRDPKGSVNP